MGSVQGYVERLHIEAKRITLAERWKKWDADDDNCLMVTESMKVGSVVYLGTPAVHTLA